MTFWIVALVLVLIIALGMIAPLLRRLPVDAETEQASEDITIYRQQLSEIDRDLARGTLLPEEAERARTEISRRILTADGTRRGPTGAAPRAASIAIAAVTAVVLFGGTAALYMVLGQPGRADLPFENRLSDAEETRATLPAQASLEADTPAFTAPADAPANYAALQQSLREAAEANPTSIENWQILALFNYRLGDYAGAVSALQQIIAVKGETAETDDRLALIEAMVSAANGRISAEARDLIADTLARDPAAPGAVFYQGLVDADVGRPDLTFAAWRDYIENSPQSSMFTTQMHDQLTLIAELAGIRYTPPALLNATAEQIMAMSPAEQRVAIQNMVDQLGQRLADTGGSAGEWAQMVRALRTLGEHQRAALIVAEARTTFAADPEALALVEEAGTAPVTPLP
ncbi:c-type cytochrome biogenesis protein CcmI [Ketogulonicigenium vulgare]|uniref:c-type cytochrome biogenesis protein CcmI n=1 Tax=Ketogulonicigenium vulgare TaxID=92945 RepID=UPI0023599C69|nr:c-type cytochrome biogenesis protein CcmI [Ketogulonicigenium vulgare]